jgi:hypothetical protein
MENDPKDNVDVTAEDELSEQTLGEVNGGFDGEWSFI